MSSSSRSRILANLNAKEKLSPGRKIFQRSSEEAFSSSSSENTSKRRTVTLFDPPQVKSKSLFLSNSTNKAPVKKQMSIKSYYKDGSKENQPTRQEQVKIFKENKGETKKKRKEDAALSLMCAEEAPEKYWELLAEERRKGLEIALKENEELADEIRSKDETIRELRTEVGELKETAEHAEYLASVIEELGKDCGVSLEESDTESEDQIFDEKDISTSFPEEKNSENAVGCSNSVSTGVKSPADASLSEEIIAKSDAGISPDLLSTKRATESTVRQEVTKSDQKE